MQCRGHRASRLGIQSANNVSATPGYHRVNCLPAASSYALLSEVAKWKGHRAFRLGKKIWQQCQRRRRHKYQPEIPCKTAIPRPFSSQPPSPPSPRVQVLVRHWANRMSATCVLPLAADFLPAACPPALRALPAREDTFHKVSPSTFILFWSSGSPSQILPPPHPAAPTCPSRRRLQPSRIAGKFFSPRLDHPYLIPPRSALGAHCPPDVACRAIFSSRRPPIMSVSFLLIVERSDLLTAFHLPRAQISHRHTPRRLTARRPAPRRLGFLWVRLHSPARISFF